MISLLPWISFIVFILLMLALDLGVLHRKAHAISVREALGWTACWISLALAFNVGVYFMYEHHWFGIGLEIGHPIAGSQAALEFLTAYLVEESLSLDNIFLIALILSYYGVPPMYQHRVLFWGILGALVLRAIMIACGIVLIRKFEWITYVFGAFLLATAVKLFFSGHEKIEPEKNLFIRLARRFYPVTSHFEGERFFTRMNGKRAITPMFLVLLLIESTDVMFAVDSIPAVFAVTLDPFLVFTSNVFAILGLRSLYFAIAGLLGRFRYFKISLVILLAFVGLKMLLAHHYPIPTLLSLGIICTILATGVMASLWVMKDDEKH